MTLGTSGRGRDDSSSDGSESRPGSCEHSPQNERVLDNYAGADAYFRRRGVRPITGDTDVAVNVGIERAVA
jgi:hypothetical protein